MKNRISQNNQTEQGVMTAPNIAKFLIAACLGICVFFIEFPIGGEKLVPMVWISNLMKQTLKSYYLYISDAICLFLVAAFVYGKVKKDSWCGRFMKKDGIFNGTLYIIALVVCIMATFQIGPDQILDSRVSVEAINTAGICLCTITVAGVLVNILTEFGLVEFIGGLISPLMRRLFHLPGQAAIDAVSSFVVSPAAGVFVTNKLYNEGTYTNKEAACIMTNFSIVSLGWQAFLASSVGHSEYYGKMIICSLLITFVMAAIVVRVPPLRGRPNTYADGSVQTEEMRKSVRYDRNTVSNAFRHAVAKASRAQLRTFITTLPELLGFVAKIVAFVAGLATVVLWLGYYTPVFDWIGKIMVPYLKVCQVPDAALVAPSTLISFTDCFLPVLLIQDPALAGTMTECAIFFILLLGPVQIIFFDESANAMLASDVPFNFLDMLVIFLVRTAIAIPICSLAAHLMFPL